jgi:predicted regulator of Ras-like GTPase activity (Roadblock/LC7/MglB family)
MPQRSQEILDALQRDCPGFGGAVLASPDGLLMVATSELGGDLPAACAAALVLQVEECLSALTSSQQVGELMLWTSGGLWFAARLVNKHVLLLSATEAHCAGAVRLAAQMAAQELNAVLG